MRTISPRVSSSNGSKKKNYGVPTTDKDLQKATYRELQAWAVALTLPGNLPRDTLRGLILAAENGDERYINDFKAKHEVTKQVKKAAREAAQAAKAKRDSPLDLTTVPTHTHHHAKKPRTATWADCRKKAGFSSCSSNSSSSSLSSSPSGNSAAVSGSVCERVKENTQRPSYAESTAFPFSSSFLSLPGPFSDYKSFNPPRYPEYPYSQREWQPQFPSTPQAPPVPMYPPPPFNTNPNYGQQSYGNLFNTSQSRPLPSMYPCQTYPTPSPSYLPPTFDPYSSAFSNYRSSSTTDSFSSVTTPALSSLPDVSDYRPQLPKPPPLNDSTQSFASLDTEMISVPTPPASGSTDSARSFSSSLENNVSWTSISQDMLNFLNSDTSLASASSMSNKRFESDDVDLCGLFPEFESNDNQSFPLDSCASNTQPSQPVGTDYPLQSAHSQCVASTTQMNLTITNNSAYYSNAVVPMAPCRGSNYSGRFCELCPLSAYLTCIFCHPLNPTPVNQPTNVTVNHVPVNPPVNPAPIPPPVSASTPFSSQDVEKSEKDPHRDSLLADEFDDSGDITIQLPTDSEDTEDGNSEGELVINEDTVSEHSNRGECRLESSASEKTYHLLEPSYSSQEMPNLDSHVVESIIKESESSQELSQASRALPYYDIVPEEIIDQVYSQSLSANDKVELSQAGANSEAECSKESPTIPENKESPSSCPQLFTCPVSSCQECWSDPSPLVDQHLRQSHAEAILDMSSLPLKFTVSKLAEEGSKTFIMQAKQMLFTVNIFHYHNRIVITLQYLPKADDPLEKTVSLPEGALEVIKLNNLAPSSWVGKIKPYFTPLTDLLALKQCLVLDPSELYPVVSLWPQIYFRQQEKFETPTKTPQIEECSERKRRMVLRSANSPAAKVARKS